VTLQKNEVFFLNFLKKRWSDVAKSFLSQTSQHGSRRVIGKIDLLAETRIETGVEEGGVHASRKRSKDRKLILSVVAVYWPLLTDLHTDRSV